MEAPATSEWGLLDRTRWSDSLGSRRNLDHRFAEGGGIARAHLKTLRYSSPGEIHLRSWRRRLIDHFHGLGWAGVRCAAL
jgi:hypothetical protein